MQNYYSTKEVADIVGKSERTVLRRVGVDNHLAGFIDSDSAGRPAKMFNPTVFKLWNVNYEDFSRPNPDAAYIEDKRADYGKPRGMDMTTWTTAVRTAKECFMSMPTKNLLEACRQTASVANLNGANLDGDYLYRRLTRRRSQTCSYTSPYYSEAWGKVHEAKYRVRQNRFYNHPFVNYNMFSMFRNRGLLGKGYGSKRVIVVDDFKRDVWVDNAGEMEMPWGLVFIDGITNFPLMIIPADTISTDIVAAGILMTTWAHGIHGDTVWVFETARAMKNRNVIGLIESLYTPEQLEAFKRGDSWVKEIFPGQTGPYVNSPANIAQSVFKSRVERSIRNFKDEFDGVYFPTTFQGGDRKEGVQLTLSGSPLDVFNEEKPLANGEKNPKPYSKRLIPIAGYWERLYNWIWGKYVSVPRAKMFTHFNTTFGTDGYKSIKQVHDFLSSDNDGTFKPDLSNMNRFAMLLFFAQPNRHSFTVKVSRIGSYQTTIDNRPLNLVSRSLNQSHVGCRVCTIPIPEHDNNYIIIDVTVADKPLFIGIAEDYTATTMEDANRFRRDIRQMRESNIERMRQDADDHYVELGDDFLYNSVAPSIEGAEWTKELGAEHSKLLKAPLEKGAGGLADDLPLAKGNEGISEEITEEITFKSKKMKDFMNQFNTNL